MSCTLTQPRPQQQAPTVFLVYCLCWGALPLDGHKKECSLNCTIRETDLYSSQRLEAAVRLYAGASGNRVWPLKRPQHQASSFIPLFYFIFFIAPSLNQNG